MQSRSSGLAICAALAALALSTACVVAPPRGAVFVRVRPPAAAVEVRGVTPGPEFIWVEGFHRWDGTRYVWVSGHWERRPHAKAVWVPGRWRHHDSGWYWVEGHWK
jgi:hypothetical protein